MRRALVVGNSDLPPRPLLDPWLERADIIVAADGGANRLLSIGVEPDFVVGDMDSLLGSSRRRLPRSALHPRRSVYRTDLEKAVEFAASRRADDVTIVGASTGRLDHVLCAVAVLSDWSERLQIRLVDEDFVTERVQRRVRFQAPLGTLASLYSPTVARGVTTKGLRWPLHRATLRRGTLGIHNHVVARSVEVSLESGELLVFRGQRVEPHR